MDTRSSFRSWFLIFNLDMIIFDLWLIMKIRAIVKCDIKLLQLLLPVLFYLVLTTVLCLGIVIIPGFIKSDLSGDKFLVIQQQQPSNDPKSSVTDLKNQILRLETELRETKMKFENHYLQQIQRELLADFASEAAGGSIISTPDTEAYFEEKNSRVTIFGLPLWKPNDHTPRKIIQAWTQAGECWAFKGSHGKIEINLAHAAKIHQVTLQHIPAISSITENINSAPKTFSVFGHFQGEYIQLDSFTYDINSSQPSQTFHVRSEEKREIPVQRILLDITSNWGHPKYTCVYRFKVHGKIARLIESDDF